MHRLDEQRDAAADTSGVDTALLVPSQSPAILSILGDQGIGKSTTLKYVCDEVSADPSRVVSPVVSPERFADGDTLFGWVLAALTDLLPHRLPEIANNPAPAPQDELTIRELVDLVRRQEALARSTYQDASAMVSASPDEWAEGVAAVTTAGLHLVTGWAGLLNGLAPHLSQFVIPVDDADQVPDLLPSVLRDLRWLTIHPKVAVVICASEEMLLQTLTGGVELKSMETVARRRQALGVLTKALPQHLRLSIDPVSLVDRPSFTPQNQTETLISLLKRFRLATPPPTGPTSLGDLFELKVGNEVEPSPYVDILPDTPRQLDQLWRALEGLSSSTDRDDATKTSDATRYLIERAIARASERHPDLPEDTIRFFPTDSHGLAVEFDFSLFTTSSTKGAGCTLRSLDGNYVSMRRIDNFLMGVKSDIQNDDQVPASTLDLPAPYTKAHFLALDLADPEDIDNPPLFLWGYVYKPSISGGSNWHSTIDVFYNHERTDNFFAPVPAWESRYDYYLYAAAWNNVWITIRDLDCTPSPKLLEWVLLRHMLFVTEVQRNRAISADLLEGTEDELTKLDDWSASSDFARLADSIEDLYRKHEGGSVRGRDFDWWVEVYLPWSADGILEVPTFTEQLLDLRANLVGKHNTLADANARCAKALSARIQENLSAEWITTTIELSKRFSPELAESMASLHEIAREERDSEVEALTRTLEQRGVPRKLVGQMLIHGVTPAVHRQLRVAGLPSAAVDALTQRFKPIDSEIADPIANRLLDDDISGR